MFTCIYTLPILRIFLGVWLEQSSKYSTSGVPCHRIRFQPRVEQLIRTPLCFVAIPKLPSAPKQQPYLFPRCDLLRRIGDGLLLCGGKGGGDCEGVDGCLACSTGTDGRGASGVGTARDLLGDEWIWAPVWGPYHCMETWGEVADTYSRNPLAPRTRFKSRGELMSPFG